MGAGNERDAANVASYMPKDGVTFTLPNDYTVTVETMPRDEITDLALLTFAKMRPVTSLTPMTPKELEEAEKFYKLKEDIKKQPKTKFLGFSFSRTPLKPEQQKKAEKFEKLLKAIQDDAQPILDRLKDARVLKTGAPTAEEIAKRVQSTFLNKPELASLMQYSIRNPRSGQEAWDLASQVGNPTGPNTGPKDKDKLKAPTFPAGKTKEDIKNQLDFVKQINLSNLATKLGISGFPRNAVKQTIYAPPPNGEPIMTTTGLGTMDDKNAEKAKQVMVAAKAGVANEKDLSITGLLTEDGSLPSYLGWADSNLKAELGTDPILKDMAKAEGEEGFPQGVKARVVSALGKKAAGSVALLGRLQEVKEGLDSSNDPEDRYKTALKKFEARNQKYNIVSRLLGSPDTADNRTLGIALASYIEKKALGKEVAIFCKSGKDRTGAVVNMTNAIAMLDHQLGEEALDLSKQANMEKLANNYRMLQQTGVRNFISGLNSEGAGVLNGIELLPKAFKEYYESNDEGKKFLAELDVAHALGKQNKGWKGSKQKDLQKKYDAIEGQLTHMENLEKSLQSTNLVAKLVSFVLRHKSRYEALKKQEPILSALKGIYDKGIGALKTIKANYETRDVQMAALTVIKEVLSKQEPEAKILPVSQIDRDSDLESESLISPTPEQAVIEKLEEIQSHYSSEQKELMQGVIEALNEGTMTLDGNPSDEDYEDYLLNQISGALSGSGRKITVTNPLPRSVDANESVGHMMDIDVNREHQNYSDVTNTTHVSNVVDFIPSHTENERSEDALVTTLPSTKERSLSTALAVMQDNVESSQERDQELRGGVETGLDPRAEAEKSLADPSVKSLDAARTSMEKAMESVKKVSDSHKVDKVDKENEKPNKNSEKNHTRTSFGGRR